MCVFQISEHIIDYIKTRTTRPRHKLTHFVDIITDANLEIVQYNSIVTVTLYFLRSKNILETNSRIENTLSHFI